MIIRGYFPRAVGYFLAAGIAVTAANAASVTVTSTGTSTINWNANGILISGLVTRTIGGTTAFTKSGAGPLAITNTANAFASVTIAQGVLTAAAGSLGTGAVTFNAESLVRNGGAVPNFNLGATSDRLALTGTLTKAGAGAYRIDFLGSAPAPGAYALITSSALPGFNAGDFSHSNLGPGLSGYFTLNATSRPSL